MMNLKKLGVFLCMLIWLASTPKAESLRGKDLMQKNEFSKESMTAPGSGFSLMNPNNFSMSQSYTTSVTSGSFGTHSYGLYLNTLAYQLYSPLTLSMDLGLYTPFYATGGYSGVNQSQSPAGSFVLPRVALDYRPTENMLFSLQLHNMYNPTALGYQPNSAFFR